MTPFEYVFGFTSIIIALSVTHLVVGVVALVMFTIFAATIGNWAVGWSSRAVTDWPAWSVLFKIAVPILQYTVCAFITPAVPDEGAIDLVAFHERERRRYLGVMLVFAVVVQLYNIAAGGAALLSEWLRDSALTLALIGAILLGFFVSARWAQ